MGHAECTGIGPIHVHAAMRGCWVFSEMVCLTTFLRYLRACILYSFFGVGVIRQNPASSVREGPHAVPWIQDARACTMEGLA